QGKTVPAVVTGKPVPLGGSLGRRDATGRGVVITARALGRRLALPLAGARVLVQGFGNVGGAAARIFAERGAKVIAVQDDTGTVYREDGLDIEALREYQRASGRLPGFPGGETIGDDAFWEIPCEFLVPAALEGQITAKNAPKIHARAVIEGANGPTTPVADRILEEKGVVVLPYVLANAGGVTVSYFEWFQDISSFFWSEAEIHSRLDRILTEAFHAIWDLAERRGIPLRTAAYVVACERVLAARAQRGLYP